MTFTSDQLNTIMDLQDQRADLRDKPAPEVASLLAAEGHPLFAPASTTPPPPPPTPPQRPPASTRRAPPMRPTTPAANRDGDVGHELPIAAASPRPVTTSTALDRPIEEWDEGSEALTPDDFTIPTLKLCQAQTETDDAEVPEGHWFPTHDPDAHSPARDLVILSVRPARSRMLPKSAELAALALEKLQGAHPKLEVPSGHVGPICSSDDALTPVDLGLGTTLAPRCAELRNGRRHALCPYAKWRNVRGKRVMECGEEYRVIVYDLTRLGGDYGDDPQNTPLFLRIRGSAIKGFKRLLTNLNLAKNRYRQPFCAFSFVATSKEETGKEDKYYVPLFSRPHLIEDADLRVELERARDAFGLGQGE